MDFLSLAGPLCAQTQPKPLPKRIMFSWSEMLPLKVRKHPGALGHPPKGAKPEALGCLGVQQELQRDLISGQAFLRRKPLLVAEEKG